MVSSAAAKVKEYLDELPDDRRKAISEWFVNEHKATGKKQLPVELIGEAIGRVTLDEFLGFYRAVKG